MKESVIISYFSLLDLLVMRYGEEKSRNYVFVRVYTSEILSDAFVYFHMCRIVDDFSSVLIFVKIGF